MKDRYFERVGLALIILLSPIFAIQFEPFTGLLLIASMILYIFSYKLDK